MFGLKSFESAVITGSDVVNIGDKSNFLFNMEVDKSRFRNMLLKPVTTISSSIKLIEVKK